MMKTTRIQWRALALAALVAAAAGCGDDESSTEPGTAPILGAYQVQGVVSGAAPDVAAAPAAITTEAVWLRFEAGGNYVILKESPHGLRSAEEGLYFATSNQVLLSPSGGFEGSGLPSLYNYSLSGDALTLSTPGVTITATRNASTPLLTGWLIPLTVLETVSPESQRAVDLSWDGTSIWMGGNTIYAFDPESLAMIDSLDVSTSAYALEWREDELWTSSNGSTKIFQIDTTSGSQLFQSVEMGAWIYGIAWDGENFWCVSNNERMLYTYDPVGDEVLSQIDLDRDWRGGGGLTFHEERLFFINGGILNECTLAPFTVVNAYRVEGVYLRGVTNDGEFLYLLGSVGDDGQPGTWRIMKAVLPVVAPL